MSITMACHNGEHGRCRGYVLPLLAGGDPPACECAAQGCTHGSRKDPPPAAKATRYNPRPLDAGWGSGLQRDGTG